MRNPPCLFLFVACVVAALPGCATRYVQGNPSTEKSDDMMGDVVISQAAAEYESSPPVCLGLMPFTVSNQAFAPVDDVRKAFHAHLAPTGIRLISLQKIDALIDPKANAEKNLQKVANATQCLSLITIFRCQRIERFPSR